jgi:Dehydroquinase class II
MKAAAYTHTSVAIRDAPVNVPGPVVEVQVNVQSVVACPLTCALPASACAEVS